ncbi:MAG: sodium:proton exchanger [Parcubacteria group bacterium SW_4_49_11]|nr:MAG: sodium:proton exchanger [Parcubacteria group bacterium SW_4_49_11]
MIETILLLVGFVFLVYGADALVSGASAVGRKLGISQLVIGLTIVALGTSMPELVINVFASLTDQSGIAIGNVLGSSTSNILLILGTSALISPFVVHQKTVSKEIPFSLLSILVVGLLVNERFLDAVSSGATFLSRSDGLVLLLIFIIFLVYMAYSAKGGDDSSVETPDEEVEHMSLLKASFLIGIGLLGLFFGGKWVVDGASFIAAWIGVSEALIGVTIVAIGTSLPELVTSVTAALKQNTDIAIGNVVGSNIFNNLWILGVSASIKPLPFAVSSNFDLFVTIGATLLLFIAIFVGKKRVIETWEGVVFLLAYVGYLAISVILEVS